MLAAMEEVVLSEETIPMVPLACQGGKITHYALATSAAVWYNKIVVICLQNGEMSLSATPLQLLMEESRCTMCSLLVLAPEEFLPLMN